ncbi:hypothetical protein C0Q70_00870 [Pomacea canaliculata]|uniref:Peptidase S1 domain-containing protein n=1 Tax=Pomacea canaliculata TaxID=400727 RepID=A0A2T7PXX2_POMCA|nr:hypothetical protein C0Q70_00870 [Pomacea canaliculata]
MWKASQEGCGVPGIKFTRPQPRIAGGRPSETGNWPWMVSLSPKPMKGQHICGGTLIASNWILTSAHCLFAIPFLYGENKWLMRLGKLMQSGPLKEETEQDFNVSLIVVHPLYDFRVLMPTEALGKPSDHDLALVKLSGDVTVTPWVRPICLPSPQFKPQPGKLCVITGWGLINDPSEFTYVT